MAKGSIEKKCYKCGTKFVVEKKCYSRDDANQWESWMADQDRLCRECYAEEMQIEREKEKAAEKAKLAEATANCPLDLPELTGSEKQIAWAKDIRGKLIADLNERGMKWDAVINKQYPDNLQPEIDKIMEASSKVWIESRGKTVLGISIR